MERAKQIAADFFAQIGFQVQGIAESDSKRADLIANDGTATYLVEVKQKLDDADQQNHNSGRMAEGEVVCHSEPHSRSNRIDGLLKHGRKQLDDTPKPAGSFSLLWFHAEGIDADLKVRRAQNTFYGLVPLIPLSRNVAAIRCFYFDYATAFGMTTVDGLLTVHNCNLCLCLNEFAVSVNAFKESKLAKELSRAGAIIDPALSKHAAKRWSCAARYPGRTSKRCWLKYTA